MKFVLAPCQGVPEIDAVNLSKGLVLLTSGDVIEITIFLNCCGDECGPAEAIVAVAGPYAKPVGDRPQIVFYTIDLSEFGSEPTH